ncbi:MnmC family methyltransferase, partial [Francisella tularensis subsp. holarctica]
KVRKALQKYGFKVKKDKGFGKKREMMYGVIMS